MANERKLADKKGKGKGTKEAGEGLLWSPYKYLLDQDGWDFKPLTAPTMPSSLASLAQIPHP